MSRSSLSPGLGLSHVVARFAQVTPPRTGWSQGLEAALRGQAAPSAQVTARTTQLLVSVEKPFTEESRWGVTFAYTLTDAEQNRDIAGPLNDLACYQRLGMGVTPDTKRREWKMGFRATVSFVIPSAYCAPWSR